MKAIKRLLLLLPALCLFVTVQAQSNLDRWMKKCETISSVEVTFIQMKDPATKKDEARIVKVNFNQQPELRKELLDAYFKDKEKESKDIISSSETRINGELLPVYCEFDKGNKVMVIYSFDLKKERVAVTMKYYYHYDPSKYGG